MYVTITLKIDAVVLDISMDDQQLLYSGLQILKNNRKISCNTIPSFYRSTMQRRIVSAYKTLKEEAIANGDKLTAI